MERSKIKRGQNRDISMDKCKNCIRYQDFELEQCIQCDSKSIKMKLNGCCLEGQCLLCGNFVVGISFFAPCEQDSNKYSLSIMESNLSNKQIIFLRKLLKISALDIKFAIENKIIENKTKFEKDFSLKEIMQITKMLQKEKISYIVEPALCYEKYWSCDRKMI